MEGTEPRASRLIEIGIALSAETRLDELFDKIVAYARELTRADGGSLYLLEDGELRFRILQNASLGLFLREGEGESIRLGPVPLVKTNVSAYAALTGRTVVIDDVYTCRDFDFEGPRRYDAETGYRSRSMLVVPLKDTRGEVLGVLQLINATDPETGRVVGFRAEDVRLCEALASQAAVALANARLLHEVQEMLAALVRVLGVAIDAKSPYTGNHVQRVARLNVVLAKALSDADEEPFRDVSFSEEELEEIRIAGWLHDVGKVVTPVHVMDKATKLEGVFDGIDRIRERFRAVRYLLEARSWRDELRERTGDARLSSHRERALSERLAELLDDLAFVERCNRPDEFMDDAALERLRRVAEKRYAEGGEERPLLTPDEVRYLSIRRGSLTDEEMRVMREHVAWTRRMLLQIPFSRALRNVPRYASQHHEKLNGTGYPEGLKGDEIPLQSRILAVADLYEALSAKDRPYKKPMPREKIFAILRSAAEAGEIDRDIVEFALRHRLFDRFEEEYRAAPSTPSGDSGAAEESPS